MSKYVTNIALPNGTNVLIKDSECRTNLSNEESERKNSDSRLQVDINTVESALNTETNRATAKETDLKNDINAETNRAIAKETDLKNDIDAETNRALNAESAIHDEFIKMHHGNGKLNSTYVESGTCSWSIVGRLCILSFNDVKFKAEIQSNPNVIIFSNVPTNTAYDTFSTLSATNISPTPSPVTTRLLIKANDTNIHVWYSKIEKTNATYSGQMIYITDIMPLTSN